MNAGYDHFLTMPTYLLFLTKFPSHTIFWTSAEKYFHSKTRLTTLYFAGDLCEMKKLWTWSCLARDRVLAYLFIWWCPNLSLSVALNFDQNFVSFSHLTYCVVPFISSSMTCDSDYNSVKSTTITNIINHSTYLSQHYDSRRCWHI